MLDQIRPKVCEFEGTGQCSGPMTCPHALPRAWLQDLGVKLKPILRQHRVIILGLNHPLVVEYVDHDGQVTLSPKNSWLGVKRPVKILCDVDGDHEDDDDCTSSYVFAPPC